MEELAFDRASLEDAALVSLQLVEPGRQERLQRRRHRDVVRRALRHRDHLRQVEGVPAGRVRDALPQLCRHVSRQEFVDIPRRKWFDVQSPGPRRPALEELGAGRAEDKERRAREQEREVLDQVEERLFGPVQVLEDDHEGRRRLEQLAKAPGDLL